MQKKTPTAEWRKLAFNFMLFLEAKRIVDRFDDVNL